jgi:transcriptional regulator with XRE-family HTH domain
MSCFDRINALREERGLSISALERNVGLSKNTIHKWDHVVPSADKLYAVAQYFGVSIEYLLTGEKKERPQTDIPSTARSKFDILFEKLSPENKLKVFEIMVEMLES